MQPYITESEISILGVRTALYRPCRRRRRKRGKSRAGRLLPLAGKGDGDTRHTRTPRVRPLVPLKGERKEKARARGVVPEAAAF